MDSLIDQALKKRKRQILVSDEFYKELQLTKMEKNLKTFEDAIDAWFKKKNRLSQPINRRKGK